MTDPDSELYASFGRRLAAWLLDWAILSLLLLLVGMTLRIVRVVGAWVPAGAGMAPQETWRALGFDAKLLVIFAYVLSLGPVYFALYEASSRQATFGKQLLNIYVTSDDRKRISIGRAVGRWAAKYMLAWFGWVVSVIMIVGSKERKGLHDAVAKTVVLRGRPVPGGPFEPWRIAASFALPFVLMLGIFLVTM